MPPNPPEGGQKERVLIMGRGQANVAKKVSKN